MYIQFSALQLVPGDIIQEVNGQDVSSFTTKEGGSYLKSFWTSTGGTLVYMTFHFGLLLVWLKFINFLSKTIPYSFNRSN